MPYAVTHVLLTIILIDLYRDYISRDKKHFSLHTVMIGGIAGLLPDIDILVAWILNVPTSLLHGTFTHTPFFALLFCIPAIIYRGKGDAEKSTLYFVIAFGVLFHLFLDWLLGGGGHYGIMWLFPLSTAGYSINVLGMLSATHVPAALDAAILIAWLWHEEVKHKISDFI